MSSIPQYPDEAMANRFWSKVSKGDTPGSCWQWTATLNPPSKAQPTGGGYGVFSVGSTQLYRAHRVAYTWLVGPIPEGHTLDHLCHNRACVNPNHLDATTPSNNIRRGYMFHHLERCAGAMFPMEWPPDLSVYKPPKSRLYPVAR